MGLVCGCVVKSSSTFFLFKVVRIVTDADEREKVSHRNTTCRRKTDRVTKGGGLLQYDRHWFQISIIYITGFSCPRLCWMSERADLRRCTIYFLIGLRYSCGIRIITYNIPVQTVTEYTMWFRNASVVEFKKKKKKLCVSIFLYDVAPSSSTKRSRGNKEKWEKYLSFQNHLWI